MFKKEPLIILSAIGLVGYATFHGHPFGKDCWLCKYRGMVFALSSIGLGTYLAFTENE